MKRLTEQSMARVLDRAGQEQPSRNGSHQPKTAVRPLPPCDSGITMAELMTTEFPACRYLVDLLIPEGLTVLAGKPKEGKSWLAYQVAIAASLGLPCLGSLGTAPAGRDCLGLFMEDTRRRLKDRGRMILAATGWPPSPRLDLRVSWPRSGSGGLAAVGEWLDQHRGGLVVVDTLAKFRDPTSGRGGGYEADYEAIGGLKAMADTFGGAVVVLDHTRKGAAESPFDEISGTLGINGAADSILVLERNGQDAGTLYTTGRDLPERTVRLGFDKASCVWRAEGHADGIERADRGGRTNKVTGCAEWIRKFVGGYAWPDKEVLAAAKRAGFTFDNVKEAKAELREGDPPLVSRASGFRGAWWCWFGGSRPEDRPQTGASAG
jgi:hypothetical protein